MQTVPTLFALAYTCGCTYLVQGRNEVNTATRMKNVRNAVQTSVLIKQHLAMAARDILKHVRKDQDEELLLCLSIHAGQFMKWVGKTDESGVSASISRVRLLTGGMLPHIVYALHVFLFFVFYFVPTS